MIDVSSKLNAQQLEAVTSESQFVRIIAGAGTGKTRTLTYRMDYILSKGEVLPRQMVAITFTNKAAKEMLDRVGKLLSETPGIGSGRPLVSTFHGFCYRFLKKEIQNYDGVYNKNFNIIDTSDQNGIFKQIFKPMPKGAVKEFVNAVVSKVSRLKEDGVFVSDLSPSMVPLGAIYTFDELKSVYSQYQGYLRQQNLLDFADLLLFTMSIMENHPDIRKVWQEKYKVFFIDEFQDTNVVQYRLVKLFLKPNSSSSSTDGTALTVVGDPDQTIYTWRGAKNKIIRDQLPHDFPSLKTVVLDKNYRSTQSILDAANNVINNNKDRMKKDLMSFGGEKGDKVHYCFYGNADSEALDIASRISRETRAGKSTYKDFAIIYRSNYLSAALEKQLTLYRIPYLVYGGLKFFERAEIKDALSYLRLLVNPDDISFQRILKAPTKGIGEKTMERAKDLQNQMPEEEATLFAAIRTNDPSLHLNKGTQLALSQFYQAYDKMEALYKSSPSNDALLSGITTYLSEAGFREYVSRVDEKENESLSYTASTSSSRVDNVNEFMRTLSQALSSPITDEQGVNRTSTLEDFLINVALQSDQDEIKDSNAVSLMTGHVSKGLEFPKVFVTGLDQMVFPNYHALMAQEGSSLEEERRLFYVAMTRAEKDLYVSSFGGTNFRNGQGYTQSQFIKEMALPGDSLSSSVSAKQAPNYYASYGSHRPVNRPFGASSVSSASQYSSSSSSLKPEDTYVPGDFVIHTSFGKGKVTKVEGNKIVVDFPDPYGEKKLMVGFKAFRKMKEEEK
ncbi:MAG: ATP-dependent helicase [Bacilli bacterium]